MSNNFAQHPLIINATMGSTFQNSVPTVNQWVYLKIEKVYWFDPASVDDEVTIVDSQGNILLELNCEVAGQSQVVDWSANPKTWADFQASELDSGTLYIYLR